MKKFLYLMLFSVYVHAQTPYSPLQTPVQSKLPLVQDPNLTPGTVDLKGTKGNVCTIGYTKTVRNVPQSLKRKVFELYNIDPKSDKFEVDHLISLELGGSNDITNLWPQSYTTFPWNARDKDALENKLHKMVCKGEISLTDAQNEISSDWTKAYLKYMNK